MSKTAASKPLIKETPDVPRWDTATRELWFRGRCIKRFRNDAANQRALLDAFEASNWPARVENPFPCRKGTNRKTQLQDTVKNLNRGLRGQPIRFAMDGTGQAVRWRVIEQEESLLSTPT